MIIRHNLPGMNAGRNAGKTKDKLSKNLEKLSSGYRINRAGDDAAGLAISEGLRRIISGTKQAEQNITDGIGLIQTAEGAMEEISAMLQRGNQLSVQSANGTYDHASRSAMQQEIEQLRQEIQRITDSTEFNGVYLLKSDVGKNSGSAIISPKSDLPPWVQLGQSMVAGQQVERYQTTETYTITDTATNTVKATGQLTVNHAAASLDFSRLTPSNKADLIQRDGTGFYSTCFTCDNHYSIRFVKGTGSRYTGSGSHHIYEIGIDNVNNGEDLVKAIVNGLNGNVDQGKPGNPLSHFTKFMPDATNKNVLWLYDNRSSDPQPTFTPAPAPTDTVSWPTWTSSGHDVWNVSDKTSSGGKCGSGVALSPGDIVPIKGDLTLQIGPSAEETLEILLPGTHEKLLGIDDVSVNPQEEANRSISKFKHALNYLSEERGRMGAYQQRLEHAYHSLTVSHENLAAAESHIRDADMAEEITSFTKNEIIMQAAQSMLSQANAIPQQVLELLP